MLAELREHNNMSFPVSVVQASVSFANNGGDIGKTLKDLASSNANKNTLVAMAIAGVGTSVAGKGVSTESGLLSSGGIGVSIGTRMQSSEQKFEQSGVTFALSSGLVSNLQSATKVVINRWWQYAP